jgi:hypothetical protein
MNTEREEQSGDQPGVVRWPILYLGKVIATYKEPQDGSREPGTPDTRVTDALAALQAQLNHEVDEYELKDILDRALPEFDHLSQDDRRLLHTEVINQLKTARACQRALEDFIDLREDIADVRSMEEALGLRDELRDISSHFEGFAVRGRVEKEYRELTERLRNLPSEAEARSDTELKLRIAKLNGDPPKCRKCGAPMILHLGRTTPFWGCSTFPRCYSRRWLTKKQRKYLGIN